MATTYDPAAFLRELYPVAAGTYPYSLSDAITTMVRCRELLELRTAHSQYPILNLYCNWTVHSELEASPPAYRVLVDATKLLLTDPDAASLGLGVSKCLSFHQLRADLIALFKAERISPHFFETATMWKAFAGQLLKAIIGKRLMFPANPAASQKAAKLYAELTAVAGARFSEAAGSLQLVQHPIGHKVFWQIERIDGSAVSGPFQNLEHQTAFASAGFYVGETPAVQLPQ